MADLHHLERFMQKVEDWNTWREEHPEITPDLSETWLHGAYHGGWISTRSIFVVPTCIR